MGLAASGGTIYVKYDASGGNDGTSWADAFTDLQLALAAAAGGDKIWVAAGTYTPTTGTDQTVSFALKNGVAVYGGFAGTETTLDQRDPAANVTILSGDLNGNDGPDFANNSDNSYHVVVGSGTDNTAVLDGFTVTGGNAGSSSGSYLYGGGLYILQGSPMLKNVIFSGSSAGRGGGIYNEMGNPRLTGVTFSDNSALDRAGGMYTLNGSPTLMNVNFISNSATTAGGGMYSVGGSPVLTNVTFLGNSASYMGGGGLYNEQSSPKLTNTTFYNNSAIYSGGGALTNSYGSTIIRNSIFWGNSSPAGFQLMNTFGTSNLSYSLVQGGCPVNSTCSHLITADPLLDPFGDYGGSLPTLRLRPGSPAIDRGNDAYCPLADPRGVTRPQGAHCDIGAFEYVAPPIVLSSLRTGPALSSAPDINFTVTFSHPVTGLDASDFALTTTGITGASLTNISGSAATYTVTVHTGSGLGSLRLDIVDDDSLEDAFHNPLGGSGAGNGSFAAGDVALLVAPPSPALLLPRNGSSSAATPAFTWQAVSGAVRYEIEFATDQAFAQDEQIHSVDDPTFAFGSALSDGTYYWRVRTYDARDSSGADLVRVTRPVPPAELPDEGILRDVINGLRAL
jgi:hypothetical protein